MKKGLTTFVVVSVMLIAPLVQAEEGAHEHRGFYLRMSTGIGYSYFKETYENIDYEIHGITNVLFISVGGALTKNLILSADVFGSTTIDPTVEAMGETKDSSGELADFGFGAGFTYYLMPINMFISFSGGFSKVSFSNAFGFQASTKIGWGVNAMIGKEWWVSDNWGLGVALQIMVTSSPEKNIDADILSTSGGVSFSATYN